MASSKKILGESLVFLETSGDPKYLSTLVIEMKASMRSVVSSGITDKVTSRLPNTPIAVKATEGVSFPYWTA